MYQKRRSLQRILPASGPEIVNLEITASRETAEAVVLPNATIVLEVEKARDISQMVEEDVVLEESKHCLFPIT